MARQTRTEWLARVRRWKRSGLTLAEFAAGEQVKAPTLSWWAWRLGETRRNRRGGSPVELVPVRLAPSAEAEVSTRPIEIACGSFVVRAHPSFDRGQLAAVLEVIAEVVAR